MALKRTLRTLPVEQVVRWENNPAIRVKRDRQFVELSEHIREEGQIDPIDVIDGPPYRIVRGHRRFEAISVVLKERFVDAWVWFEPFDVVLARLLPTERMQRAMVGRDIGQVLLSLGIAGASPLMRVEDARAVQDAFEQLSDDAVFWMLVGRYGPRVFHKLLPLVMDDRAWTLDRICRAVLAKGSYRDLEQKGLSREQRLGILEQWETQAS